MKRHLYLLLVLSACSFVEDLQKNVQKQNKIDFKRLTFAKENRELRARVIELESELKKSQLGPKRIDRFVAAEKFQRIEENWNPDELLFVAEIEYEREDFEKAAHFFNGILEKFPSSKLIDDGLLFRAAKSTYESGKNYKKALKIFERIISDYPKSKYFLQAKLWISLIYSKIGEKQKLKKGLIEFQEKYQNAPEWKILEKNYEKIINN